VALVRCWLRCVDQTASDRIRRRMYYVCCRINVVVSYIYTAVALTAALTARRDTDALYSSRWTSLSAQLSLLTTVRVPYAPSAAGPAT
jgi:hypothetical protein